MSVVGLLAFRLATIKLISETQSSYHLFCAMKCEGRTFQSSWHSVSSLSSIDSSYHSLRAYQFMHHHKILMPWLL